jgi:hypothetical protein
MSWPLASKEVRLKKYIPKIVLLFKFTNFNVAEARKIPNNKGG